MTRLFTGMISTRFPGGVHLTSTQEILYNDLILMLSFLLGILIETIK